MIHYCTPAEALADELRSVKTMAIALAATCIYLDPHSDRPDSESRMYCAHCSNYGEPGEQFRHKWDCLVGKILASCGNHVIDDEPAAVAPVESHIEYQSSGGRPLVRMTHHEAAEARGRGAFGGSER